MKQPFIFQQFESLARDIPWISLGQFPTPVERLSNLEKLLELKSLWIKRDDLSGELYGGNKVRTLEFSLAAAKQKQADLIFTYSAVGSNWPLACVIYCKLQGLLTDVFFMPYPMDAVKKRNLQITQRLARRIVYARSLFTFPFLLYFNLYKAKGKNRVYLMPPGGTSPITTLGHINAVFELKQQHEKSQLPIPDYIFCPFGSGGTAAGLAIGLSLIDWPTQVLAVRVVDYLVANRLTLKHLIWSTVKTMRQYGCRFQQKNDFGENIKILHEYFGKGYSQPTPAGQKCIELLKTLEAQELDSAYTAKTFAAILTLADRALLKNKNILFWQTLNSRSLDDLEKLKGEPT